MMQYFLPQTSVNLLNGPTHQVVIFNESPNGAMGIEKIILQQEKLMGFFHISGRLVTFLKDVHCSYHSNLVI